MKYFVAGLAAAHVALGSIEARWRPDQEYNGCVSLIQDGQLSRSVGCADFDFLGTCNIHRICYDQRASYSHGHRRA